MPPGNIARETGLPFRAQIAWWSTIAIFDA